MESNFSVSVLASPALEDHLMGAKFRTLSRGRDQILGLLTFQRKTYEF